MSLAQDAQLKRESRIMLYRYVRIYDKNVHNSLVTGSVTEHNLYQIPSKLEPKVSVLSNETSLARCP